MRRPSRRVAVASAAIALALVAGVAVAVVTRAPEGGTSALSPLDVPREVAPEQPVHSPTASKQPTPSPSRVRPVATQASSAPGDPAFEPRLPGSVVAPYRPGQTSWDVTSNGFRIHVTTTRARQGAPMRWTISASSAQPGCCVIFLGFGDGFGGQPQMDCEHPAPSVSYSHVYNRAGRHPFSITVHRSPTCFKEREGALYGYLDVLPGTTTAQGPAKPTVQFDYSVRPPGHEDDYSYVSIYGEVQDEDGWVTRLVVTWGDGASKTYGGDTNPTGCHEGPDGWPTGSRADLPHDPYDYHHFTKPGTYTITLTGYSAGCDGSTVQQASKSFTWTVD